MFAVKERYMSETGSVGIGNEPCMHAALPFCSAIDKRWNKKEVSRLSPVAAEMRLPSSCKISTASSHHTPVTSHANGAKMWFLANSSYFAILSRAARSAAAPAWTAVSGRYDAANVSATVTSHAMFLPRAHGTIEAPSGLLLAEKPCLSLNAKQRPVGSFWACILARIKERQIASLRRLCRTCLPFPFLQVKQWRPSASTIPPQIQSWGRQTEAPIRKPTAIRSSSFSRNRPQFADGIAKSQSPEWGAEAAKILELSRSEGHVNLKCRFIASTTRESQERCLADPGAWTGWADANSHQTDRHPSKSLSDFHAISGIILSCNSRLIIIIIIIMNFYSPVSNTRCHSIGHKMRIARIKIRVDSPLVTIAFSTVPQ